MAFSERVNVLLVDGQLEKLLSYEVILKSLDENLIKAESAREALDILQKTDIAVILMDVSMPEISGFELADLIRQHTRFKDTAIIFISSAHLTDVDRTRAYERGAADYVSVPIVPELLRAKVSVFADLHRKTRKLEALNQELRTLSASLIAAQDNERRRIARELHDSLGQELTAAKMMAESVLHAHQSEERKNSAARECSVLIDGAIQQVRSISQLLHPPFLDEVGLQSALQFYLQGISSRNGIEATIKTEPADFPRLANELETAIFRIAQEALANVLRHSGATRVVVELVRSAAQVTLKVQDNGKGISEEIVGLQPGSVGVGIAGMKQRVKEFDGQIRLENTGDGSLVEVSISISASLSLARAAS
jgi:signal transduction histidine kinase